MRTTVEAGKGVFKVAHPHTLFLGQYPPSCCLIKILFPFQEWIYVRGYHFLQKGVPNLQNVGINKIVPPSFRQQIFYNPPITNTPYPLRNRLNCIEISLFEQNKHYLHLATLHILVIKKFYDPLVFFPKIYDPQYI